MKKGKIIVIEGTDCSGKETQSKLLIERLNKEREYTKYMSFPNYDSTTGKIVGYPYLGKSYIARDLVFKSVDAVLTKLKEKYGKIDENMVFAMMEIIAEEMGNGWFMEGAVNVDAKVASLYYIADRAYNKHLINELVDNGTNVILDRYSYSNMAHQGGKILDKQERYEMYKWCEEMEFKMMNLPQVDIKLFLHMPPVYSEFLKQGREEQPDEHEKSAYHLYSAERAYLEIAELYGFDKIDCIRNKDANISFDNIKTKEEINEEVYETVKKRLKK